MPFVTLHLGITIPGSQEYSSVRVDAEYVHIDTEGDVPAQIVRCREVADELESALEEDVAKKAANASGLSIEGMGVAGDLKSFQERMEIRTTSIIGEVERHKITLEAADANGVLKVASKADVEKARKARVKAKEKKDKPKAKKTKEE